MFQTVLFPLDQSQDAFETAAKAFDLARSHNSRLIVLLVKQPNRLEMHDQQTVATRLAETLERFEQAGLPCDVVEREGRPAFVICDVADELNVDVIVMGTRGVNLEAENGSTAARVIQLAPCPVLVVP